MSHEWDRDGEKCLKCGDKDWFVGSVCEGRMGQDEQPTPRTDEVAFYAGDVGDEVVRAELARQLERELSERDAQIAALREAAGAVLNKWDSPSWEWYANTPTAQLMQELRAALAASRKESEHG